MSQGQAALRTSVRSFRSLIKLTKQLRSGRLDCLFKCVRCSALLSVIKVVHNERVDCTFLPRASYVDMSFPWYLRFLVSSYKFII